MSAVTHTQAAVLEAMTQGKDSRLAHYSLSLPRTIRGRGEVIGSPHPINGCLLPSYLVAALVSRSLVRLHLTGREARHYVITDAGREAAKQARAREAE